jgi:predicted nicotinamide N-methyase
MPFPLKLQTVLLQEQSIEIFVPDADAVKKAYDDGDIAFPYWSKLWLAAIGLSEFILLHPHYLQDKTVLELGAGLGLPSMVAARYAAHVLCTDAIEEATRIAAQAAAQNNLKNVSVSVMDWHYLPEGLSADVLLLSDINYEPLAFEPLLKMIERFLAKATTILLSTPQRLMAKDFVALLEPYCKTKEERVVNEVTITVMVLKK